MIVEPDVWHAPGAYWFWHRLPTAAEVRDQVAQLAAAGYRSFQIQARLAFPIEQYLGPEYLAACRLAADEAARHGMLVGIYDEYNWLSGHAGGRTVAGRDELRERHLFWATATDGTVTIDDIRPTDVEALLDPGMSWVFENGKVVWDEWEIVAALAHPAEITDEHQIVDVTARFAATSETGCTVRVDAPDGMAVTVFVAARCASSKMINYLLPEAAQRFVEVGYEPYREAFGEHFGTTVGYAFFDQPHACFFRWRQHHGTVGSSLMYAPALEPHPVELLALVHEVGPTTAARRCDFFDRYSRLGIEAFFGTLSAYCRRHGIELSGHEVLGYVSSWDFTGTIITDDPRPNFGTDYFGLDRFRDRTAVDARNSEPQLGAKLGDSVARSHGRSGCIVEQYYGRTVAGAHFAAGRWELTLRDLRSQAIRHHLLGARQLLMHAFWQTDGWASDGPAELFTNPRFDFAPGVNFEPWFDHHRAFALESGRLSEFIDATEPDCAVAVLYPMRTSWAHGPGHPYGAHGAAWTEHLARTGHGYHLIDERDLRSAGVDGGELVLGERRYAALVLPGVEVVQDAGTVAALEGFRAAGGTVLASGPLPGASQVSGIDPALTVRAAAACSTHWPHVPTEAELEQALRPLRGGHTVVVGDGETVWSRCGRAGATTRVALFLDGEREQTVTVTPTSVPARVRRVDLETGAETDLGVVAGALRLRCRPEELVCLVIDDGEHPVPGETVLADGWTLDGQPIRVDAGWEVQGRPEFSGVAEYRVAFDAPAEWPEWELLLPAVHTTADVTLNGVAIGRRGWAPYTFPITADLLRTRGNDLQIRVASTAANAYYAGSGQQGEGLDPSGLAAAPILRPVLAD